MPKQDTRDSEEITQKELPTPSVEQGLSPDASALLDEIRRMREENVIRDRELGRLKAIADQTKGQMYDRENREQFHTGHLRFISDPADPVIHWKTVTNSAYIDPVSQAIVEDQRSAFTTRSGKTVELTLQAWNQLRSNYTHFKFLKMDPASNLCDIQLSIDNGTTFTGDIMKDVGMSFVNP